MANLKARFLRTFANLPLGLRNEIAVVVENDSLSWNALKIEVENNTSVGQKGLEILDRLNFLAKNEKN